MSKEIDLIKCIIFEIDKSLYSDFGGNLCISYTPNLKKLLLALNTPEVRYYFDNQDQKIKDLEVKLTESKKQCQECKHLNKKIELNIKNKLINENQQLKQQLHDLPKKIVEEIRDDMSKRIMEKQIKWGDNIQIGFICNAINECLDTILKKFGDKNESNND